MENNYDLIVFGGGTSGCAAAYIAGINGLKTLLIEKSMSLGGSISHSLVVPVMFNGENQINTNFFNALVKNMNEIKSQITYQNNKGWFNPVLLPCVLDSMMKSANVDVIFNCDISTIQYDNGKYQIKSKELLSSNIDKIYSDNNLAKCLKNHEILSEYIISTHIIDATGDAKICQKLNCKFLEDSLEFQPMSLRFVMGGVDLETFSKWLLEFDSDRNVTTVEYINNEIHLSTAYTWDTNKHWALAPLFDNAVNNGVLKDSDRNYFQLFSIAGMPNSIAFNCPRVFDNLNPNNNLDITNALISGRESILRLSEFCKKYFKGFENAYISNIADNIGVRVSNRVKCKYTYTINDLKEGKTFDNPVLISNYPVDVHSAKKDSSILSRNNDYQLPIESLMVDGYDNLFVTGRCLGADYLSQGALRVQASCFSMGEGVAKYIAKTLNK